MDDDKKVCLIAMVCGLLSVLFYLLHDVVGAMNYPGYDPMRQAVSDLTATDAPSFPVAIGYSSVYGIFSCICCILLCLMARNESKVLRAGIYIFTAMELISAIGYSLFPLSSGGYDGSVQSFIHVYVVTVLVVLLSIISLLTITVGSFRNGRKALALLAAISLVCMFIGAVGSTAVPPEVFGAIERLSTYSAVAFTGILGMYWYISRIGSAEEAIAL